MKVQGIKKKRRKKEMWTHEGPMCFKRKLAHVQKKIREK
jgi:hypothetical protein